MDDLESIARLIEAVRPWLGHLVIVGGWAHRLHRFDPSANPPTYPPLQTRDADLAFSPSAPMVGDIGAALVTAGFERDLSGEHIPPVSQYRLGQEDQGFYAEFLVPLSGGAITRGGLPDATFEKAGVTAQKLRYVDILLTSPWRVDLGKDVGIPLTKRATVQIANPVSFIAQKLLIQRYRPPAKQAQDALYIHDTMDLFGRSLETLRRVWIDEVRPTLSPESVADIKRLRLEQFGAVTDVMRRATVMVGTRGLGPDRFQAACAYGLDGIFGE